MKEFILTINFDGKKSHSSLDTNEINKDTSKVTKDEMIKALLQLEFAKSKIDEMKNQIIEKIKEG